MRMRRVVVEVVVQELPNLAIRNGMMTELDRVEDENMKDRLEFVSDDSDSTGVILNMHRHELPCAL